MVEYLIYLVMLMQQQAQAEATEQYWEVVATITPTCKEQVKP